MKIISVFQRYLSESRIVTLLLLLLLFFILLRIEKLSPLLIVGFLVWFLVKIRRSAIQKNIKDLISIVETKKIDNETKVYLIEFAERKYLILANNNWALKLREEKSDIKQL
ncbi:MAG: hypothetical protein QW076_01775 [Candidatus Anstonellales archaeon]